MSGMEKFSDVLWDGWNLVKPRSELGVKSMEQVSDWMKKRSRIEKDYISALEKLVESAPTPLEAGTLVGGCFQTLIEFTRSEAANRRELQGHLRINVHEPLSQAMESYSKEKKHLLDAGTSLEKRLHHANEALKESKLEYYKAHNDVEVCKVTLDEWKKQLAKDPNCMDPARIDKMEKKLLKLAREMTLANSMYVSTIAETNEVVSKHHSLEGMGKVLNEFQALETLRIQRVKNFTAKYFTVVKQTLPIAEEMVDTSEKMLAQLDTRKDIKQFMMQNRTKEIPPEPFVYEPYAEGYVEAKKQSKLSSMMWKIKKKDGGPTSPRGEGGGHMQTMRDDSVVFGHSLEDLMKSQPHSSGVPEVLPALMEALEELGGFETEGIFRHRPGPKEFDAAKVSLESRVYDKFPDPHVVASLLKMWFRELPESLISQSLYDRCVEVTKPEQAVEIFNELPELPRRVAYQILEFLRRLSADEHVEQTRMTVDNLAMVFAPSFLRTPSLELMMTNAEKEKLFVKNLLLGFDQLEKVPYDDSRRSRADAEAAARKALPTPPVKK